MDTEFSERMTRAAQAFDLVVLQKQPLRDAASTLGVSHETVRRDVASYKQFLGEQRGQENLEERRAAFIASLDEIYRMARDIYNACMKDVPKGGKKPLAATAALNTMVALQAHYRAVGALDSPKEVRADVDQLVRVVWDEADEPFHTR
jgi:hypothetical protein